MNPTLLDSDKEWMNTSSVSDFASKIDFAPELYAEYLEITDFMTKGRNAQVPTMHTKYTQMKESFVELNEMYRKYMAEVSAKFQKIEELIEKSSKDVAMQDHWWESTNIFNGSELNLACAMISLLNLLRNLCQPIEASPRANPPEVS